ncbi:hypothetical protein GCM10010412_001670 [Nonomuraea recticatena]|uniref:Uncharacterized protein n=1 Tax=Nonomuraea recticatena TaxID=46178 RepID=A0ABN3R2I7_9ACTN
MSWGTVELEPEVRKWLQNLPVTSFARVAFYVDLLEAEGPLLGEPYTKQLDGKLVNCGFTLTISLCESPTGSHLTAGSCS